eukprot:COSAG05_NODE_4229_length_1612_cov_7.904164_1_plen_248_part_00
MAAIVADDGGASDEALLEAAVSSLGPATAVAPRREDVAGVPGAYVIRGALTQAETAQLGCVVRAAHRRRDENRAASDRAGQAAGGAADIIADGKARRDSQHHIPIRAEAAALGKLAARLRPWLPPLVGPPGGCAATLAPPGSEVSGFFRCYHYKEGDVSNPHFDRSFREHDNTMQVAAEEVGHSTEEGAAAPQQQRNRRAGRGPLIAFSAYSVLLYLNDDFEGGCTTFFSADDAAKFGRKGPYLANI